MSNFRIFGLGKNQDFSNRVAKILINDVPLNDRERRGLWVNEHHEERRPDGEVYTTALANVRGADVFVISSLYGDDEESVDEKLLKTLIFIHTLRHASAGRITLLSPYLAYMRQDRKTESRAPIATQAVAMMLEAVGVDRVLTMDVHNLGAEQNAFRVPIDNLEGRKLLADAVFWEYIGTDKNGVPETSLEGYSWKRLKVLSPDAGGTQRTKLFQHSLAKRLGFNVGIVHADKTRIDSEKVKIEIIGDVEGCNIIAVDDMISTGGTIAEVAEAVNEAGGTFWGVAATHGLYVGEADWNLRNIPRVFTTNTINRSSISNRRVVDVAPLFAEAIRRIHYEGGSISELLED